MERVRSELSQMDAEVKRARQQKEQKAQEQRAKELLRVGQQKILYSRKPFGHPAMHLPSPPPYPGMQPGRAALPKSQAVDEVLDLTVSPCSSPEPKPTHANGALSLNGVEVMNSVFGMRTVEGRLKIPETSHLEELISQEQQRERRPTLQHNMARNSMDTMQTIHTLKQHTALSVLQQNRANPGYMLSPQQNSAPFNTQLLRHRGSKPDINTLTSHGMRVQQFQPHVNSMSRPSHLLPIQQNGHHHSLMHVHTHSLHTHVRENKMPVSDPAPLSLKLGQQSQQGSLSSQSVTENSATPQDDFSFNLDLLGHASYPQAPPSPSFPCSSPGTSSLFSSEPQSSSLSDSISPSLFAPSSEPLPLPLVNGHCSRDSQDAHKAPDRMNRIGSADRRSVIQFNPLEWDST